MFREYCKRMIGKRTVTIRGEEFKFCCAHFVAHKGFRERLHGHNYTVEVQMAGPMSEVDGYVIDFGDVKKGIRMICKSLNERIIVPIDSDHLSISIKEHHPAYSMNEAKLISCSQNYSEEESVAPEGQVEIMFENSAFFSFPKSDCALLPIKFSTAESLSAYIAHRLAEMFRAEIADRNIESLTVSVFERPTQAASYTMSLAQ
jgi:6-pyruvoyl-tetrahydropterin synthase